MHGHEVCMPCWLVETFSWLFRLKEYAVSELEIKVQDAVMENVKESV